MERKAIISTAIDTSLQFDDYGFKQSMVNRSFQIQDDPQLILGNRVIPKKKLVPVSADNSFDGNTIRFEDQNAQDFKQYRKSYKDFTYQDHFENQIKDRQSDKNGSKWLNDDFIYK